MTPQSIITLARYIVNDTDANAAVQRQSNDELVLYVNEGLKEASKVSPGHFEFVLNFDCVAGKTEQVISFTQAQEFLEVIRIKDGKAVHVMDLMAINQFNPDWGQDAAAPAQNWVKYANDKLRFYIYPKAPVMQTLELSCIRNPQTYTLTDQITEVPNTWEPLLADYVIFRAESKDDEHVNSGRAVAAYNSFLQKLGAA